MNQNQNGRRNRTPPRAGSPYNRQARARQEAARKNHERQVKMRKRKESLKIFRGRTIVFLVVLFLLSAAVVSIVLINFHSAPDSPENIGKIKYYFGGALVRESAPTEGATNGGIYICFNDLSEYLGMAESGSAAEMKFLIPSGEKLLSASGNGDEEYVVFFSDTSKVVINGQAIALAIPNVIHGEEVWVSTTFIKDYMNGISVEYSEKKSTVTVARIKDETKSTGDSFVYADVSFKLKSADPETSIGEDPLVGDVIFGADGLYDLDFTADLSEFEEYMNPDGKLRDAFLTLVNADNMLSSANVPDDLIDVKYTSASKTTQQLKLYAAKSLEALFKEMHAIEYYDMAVYSGYRSYSYQDSLFEQYVANEMAADPTLTRERAEAIVLTYSTKPGTSEHQTGLAVDMDTMGAFSTDFQYTDEYKWLMENAWKFGFILRFPADKVDITTIQFEPWHFRYVGRYHALRIHESGLCLEEYLKEIKK